MMLLMIGSVTTLKRDPKRIHTNRCVLIPLDDNQPTIGSVWVCRRTPIHAYRSVAWHGKSHELHELSVLITESIVNLSETLNGNQCHFKLEMCDFSHISHLLFVISSVLISSGSLLHARTAFLDVRMSFSTLLTSISIPTRVKGPKWDLRGGRHTR